MVEEGIIAAEHGMIEGVHLIGHLALPALPDRGCAVGEHEAPAGILGVLQHTEGGLQIAVVGQHIEQVPVAHVAA